MVLSVKALEVRISHLLTDIRQVALEADRDPSTIQLVAVSKLVDNDLVLRAHEYGLRLFAENRVQQLLKRLDTLPRSICWHFIGHLQTNKVKSIVGRVPLIHSVDTMKLARVIDYEARKCDYVQDILIEVNVSDEESKFGFYPQLVLQAAEELGALSNVRVCGLMTMAPYTDDEDVIRECFSSLRVLRDTMNVSGCFTEELRELSMGMTNDYKIAIAEGATYLRIGSALFMET